MKTKKSLSQISKTCFVASLLIGAALNQSNGATPPQNGLVGWWQFESNLNDSTSCPQNGQAQGSVSYGPGVSGNGLVFSGSEYVSIPANSTCPTELNFSSANGFTIELFINPDDVDAYAPLLAWDDENAGFGAHLCISQPAGAGQGPRSLFGRVNCSSYDFFLSSAPVLIPGVYQHVAMSYDKTTGIARLYHNGVKVAEQGFGTVSPFISPSTSGNVYLGYIPTLNTVKYAGGMDGLGIYNRVLSDAEIACIFSPSVPAPAGLVGWWPMEGNGADIAGYPENAQPEGYPIWYEGGPVGQSAWFNTINRMHVTPNPFDYYALDLGSGDGMTIEFWVYPSDTSNDQPLIEWAYDDGNGYVWSGTKVWLKCFPGTGHYLSAMLTEDCGVGAYAHDAPFHWQHVAVTYDKASGISSIFINGTYAGGAVVGNVRPATALNMYFGYDPVTGASFYGGLDEVSIYNRALSAQEIALLAGAPEGKKHPWNPAVTGHTILAWYKGEGNGYDGTGGHNSIDMSNIQCGDGEVGRGFVFPAGASAAVWDGNLIYGGPGYATSIELWIKPASVNQDQQIFGFQDWNGHTWGTQLGITASGTLYVKAGNDNPPFLESAQVCIANEWQHVALVCDHYFGYATLYHNGVNVGSVYVGSMLQGSEMLWFGPFEGSMDEITFIGSSLGGLSQSDVQGIYQAGPSGKRYDPSCFEQ